jgi:hypothetical protein
MKTLKLLILLCINAAIYFLPQDSNACGFTLYKEEWRFWTFDPNIGADPGLRRMFYSIDFFHEGFQDSYYYNPVDDAKFHETDEYQTNVKQWLHHCKQLDPNSALTEKDITTLLYETLPQDYFKLREGLIKENKFMAFLFQHPILLAYIDFAKKCEYFSNYPQETWACEDCPRIVSPGNMEKGSRYNYTWYGSVPNDTIQTPQLMELGKQMLAKTHDVFLKERIAFQMVRLSFYQGLVENTNAYFQQYLAKLPNNNWLKNNAFMYTVLKLEGAERNIGLARIFGVCPDKRYRCVQLFDKSLFEATLKLAKNTREEVLVRILFAINQPMEQLHNLQKITQLEPNNPLIPMLWVREINKLEDWVMGSYYSEFGSTRFDYWDEFRLQAIQNQRKKDLVYAAQVTKVLEQTYKNALPAYKDMYALCLGFVKFMQKDLNGAQQAYALVQTEKLNHIAKVQFALCKVMLTLSNAEKITPKIEDEVAAVLHLLQTNQTLYPQRREMLYSLVNFMAKEFIQRGEKAKGLMLYGFSAKPYADHPLLGLGNVYTQIYTYATQQDIDQMLHIIGKTNKTSLEKFLCGKVFQYTYDYDNDSKQIWDINKLRDIQSMLWVQEDKLFEAYKVLQLIDTAYWSNDVYQDFKADNPFCLNPWNTHLPMNFTKMQYNKVSFLKELIRLKTSLPQLKGEEKARVLMSVANAYYSMTYNGKYWIMQKNYQGGSEPYEDSSDVDPTYYSAARARYYYKQILQTSKDPHLIGGTVYILQVAFENSTSQSTANKLVLKNNAEAKDIYEQMSMNCDLFYEFIKTYNYFGPPKKTNARKS